MKVLIISANIAQSPFPVYPLGASVIINALKRAGYESRLFDYFQNDCSLDAVTDIMESMNPEVVGISMRNVDNVNLLNEQKYLDVIRLLVDRIRRDSKAKIILGGAGFSLMPEALLAEMGGDYGVVGEGEKLIVDLVYRIACNDLPEQRIFHAPHSLAGPEILAADYDPELLSFYLKFGKTASVQTKRGCPNQCVYCTYPIIEGSRIRPRLPSDVIDDVERLLEHSEVKSIFFTDSVFNDREGHYLDIVKAMKERRIHVPWSAFLTPNNITEEAVDLMQETGFNIAEIGSDATTDTTLRKLGKDFLFDEVLKCNDMLVERGITVAHYFIFGCPGETQETTLEGLENLKTLKRAALFVFLGIRILPNTPLKKKAEQEGLVTPEQNYLNPIFYISPNVEKTWLEQTLKKTFSKMRQVVFPPDALEDKLRLLHKMNFTGSALEFLIKSGPA